MRPIVEAALRNGRTVTHQGKQELANTCRKQSQVFKKWMRITWVYQDQRSCDTYLQTPD
jgi:hypothetical protein